MVLKEVKWVHIDKIRSNGLERRQFRYTIQRSGHIDLERSQFGTQ